MLKAAPNHAGKGISSQGRSQEFYRNRLAYEESALKIVPCLYPQAAATVTITHHKPRVKKNS